MGNSVRILHLEDDAKDAELVEAVLAAAGWECRVDRVQMPDEFRQALAAGGYDLILADYTLPAYDGLSALRLARDLCPAVPFIFVSGTMGENAAIEALTGGATDYVLKHRLSRLVPAAKRALREAEDSRERKRAEEKQRQLETQLFQTQRLESLGVLARGIAHDFNNILAGIRMLAEALQSDPDSWPTACERLGQIRKATQQGADLTRQILTYAGETVINPQPLDLSEIVEEMEKMLEVAVSKKAVLQCQLAPDLPRTEADAGQIRQVVLNFVVNASEALGDSGGVISIVTSRGQVDDDYAILGVSGERLSSGQYVCLEVTDTGCGMDEATLNRIFEPFYTTKFAGRGLGLATVRGIIRAHRGALLVTSEQGKGSTFRVLLPITAVSAPLPTKSEPTRIVRRHGSGIVLVADDEEAVRQGEQALLGIAGFDVVTASDGEQALDVFRRHQGKIVCVLLDMTMPKMSGEEVFREIRRTDPEVRVVLTSGYTQEAMKERFAGEEVFGFVQKPESIDGIIAKLQKELSPGGSEP